MTLDTPQWKDFTSSDFDQVQSSVSSMVRPHKLSLKTGLQPLQTRIRRVQFGDVSLMRLGYGADVRIQSDELGGFYLIQLPQQGQALIRCGDEKVESSTQVATVLNPHVDIDMIWYANNEQLMLKVDRVLVEQLARSMGFSVPSSGLVFPVKLQQHRSASWQLMLRYLLDCARHAEAMQQSPLLTAQLAQLVATTFLEQHPPLQVTNQRRLSGKVLPKHIRLVENYLHDYADQAICIEGLAAMAQVSTRSLYAGFKEFCGISPMQYLRQIRLDRVREDLLATTTPISISEVALRWGFMHQGRFSQEYKQRFAETPSQSIQRLRT